MAGYNSKFTGQQVDSLLEKAGSSYQKPETGIPQSDLDESTQQILQNVGDKVNKEEGKGLSTNDFTDEYKAKVEDSASQEGYFPKMSVGIAANLAGRGEATEQVFTYRPTDGGTSIESGVAKIRRIKGNSVVFNQLVKNALDQSGNNGWWSRQGANNVELNGSSIKLTFVSGTSSQPQITQKANFVLSHKYLVSCEIKSSASKTITCYLRESSNLYGESIKNILWMPTDGQYQTIYTSTGGYPYVFISVTDQVNDVGDSVTVSDIQLIDLTAMFGAGNEPTTVEEFRALYPNSYYPYNAGELRNLDCRGIKTVGFNQWDEEWVNGYYRIYADSGAGNDGGFIENSSYIATAKPMKVLPNTQYYVKSPYRVMFGECDINGIYTGNHYYVYAGSSFTTSSNCFFVIFYVDKAIANATYNNDICINLHHTGWRDGDYEPYKEVAHALPLSKITNGEPLRKAGSVYDEINETHYIKRVGVVDLGELEWSRSVATPTDNVTKRFFYAQINGLQLGYGTIMISAPYDETNIAPNSIYSKDKTIYCSDNYVGGNSPTAVIIRDSSYNDKTSFKTAMSGVMLNYALAEPIVTPIETSLNLDYQAEDFGTEEALLTDNSAPFSADIVYQFNAVDRIRENSLDIADLLARVIALENAAATTTSIPDIPDITE